jgi:Zn-dependent metalloprotease
MDKLGVSDFHPIQCILPPHMVDAIKRRGDDSQRKMAEQLEKLAAEVRVEREAAAPSGAFRGVAAMPRGVTAHVVREVYDGETKVTLPGVIARREGDPAVADAAVNDVYDAAGDVFNLYYDNWRRNSLDGNGLTLVKTVHHRKNFNNAFWNGSQMAYGDGDGVIFKGFAVLSVVGHELSHGVVQFSGGLEYRDQAGALNESFADVFGALSEQYKHKQSPAEASWVIGTGIFGPNIQGVALRSMKAPGTAYNDPILGQDPQPYHMDLYVNTSSDNGGVHINSGIPNHAFYLLAQYLGGHAWEKAGKIWYGTMQAINNPFATFRDWADKTVEIARTVYGAGSIEMVMTRRAWKLVGIDVG